MGNVPRLAAYGQTDTGLSRDHNEDAICWDGELGLAILADGMGGHNAGEVASALAVDEVASALRTALDGEPNQDWPQLLRRVIAGANDLIHGQAQAQLQYNGMGTTLVLVLFRADMVYLGHVGDSRIYRMRNRQLEQLTSDHSLLQELVDTGYMTQEEADSSVNKNLITRALGNEESVEVDVAGFEFQPGDLFMLCSDGLSDLVSDEEIEQILQQQGEELVPAVQALVARANECGGTDNISVILLRVLEPENTSS